MSMKISGRHLEVTPAIHDYVRNKLSRINKHFDKVVESQVTLSIEKLDHIAEITLRAHGKDIHCSAKDENLYAAIDLLADKVDRQIRKTKEKAQEHFHESAKRQPLSEVPLS